MKWNTFFIFLCSSAGYAFGEKCECFIRYYHDATTDTESSLNFTKNVEDTILTYVVGFTFKYKVKEMYLHGGRNFIKVNDTLWFVNGTNFDKNLVMFDLRVTHSHRNEIERITFNGETICQKKMEDDDEPNKNSAFASMMAIPILNLVLIIVLLGLHTLLVIKVSKLMTLTDKHWQEAINQVVDIQRRLSPNNPNFKGVPLPEVPGSKLNKRGTYIDLQAYQCKNLNYSTEYNRILRAVNQLPDSLQKDIKFSDGNASQGNEYVIHDYKPRKQGTL